LTIIFENGDEFWIEQIRPTVDLEDAAGRYNSDAFALERTGNVLSFSCVGQAVQNNNNSEAVGSVEVRDASGANISYGERLSQIRVRVNKQIGTAGTTTQTYQVTLFMRKGSN